MNKVPFLDEYSNSTTIIFSFYQSVQNLLSTRILCKSQTIKYMSIEYGILPCNAMYFGESPTSRRSIRLHPQGWNVSKTKTQQTEALSCSVAFFLHVWLWGLKINLPLKHRAISELDNTTTYNTVDSVVTAVTSNPTYFSIICSPIVYSVTDQSVPGI
jgi:hypothetical protein